jgi:hypothetical protein
VEQAVQEDGDIKNERTRICEHSSGQKQELKRGRKRMSSSSCPLGRENAPRRASMKMTRLEREPKKEKRKTLRGWRM